MVKFKYTDPDGDEGEMSPEFMADLVSDTSAYEVSVEYDSTDDQAPSESPPEPEPEPEPEAEHSDRPAMKWKIAAITSAVAFLALTAVMLRFGWDTKTRREFKDDGFIVQEYREFMSIEFPPHQTTTITREEVTSERMAEIGLEFDEERGMLYEVINGKVVGRPFPFETETETAETTDRNHTQQK